MMFQHSQRFINMSFILKNANSAKDNLEEKKNYGNVAQTTTMSVLELCTTYYSQIQFVVRVVSYVSWQSIV